MTREEKNQAIDELQAMLKDTNVVYLADASSKLMGETKQGEKSKTCRKLRSRGQDMPALVRQLRKSVRKRPKKDVAPNEGDTHEEGLPVPLKNQGKCTSCFL